MPFTIYIFLMIQLLFVAWADFRSKKISNYWSIINIIFYIFAVIVYKEHFQFVFDHYIYSVIILVAGFAFFLLNIMGGGDTKYLCTLYLLIPTRLQDDAFYYLLLSTIGIGSSLLLMNVVRSWSKIIYNLKRKDWQGLKTCFGSKFSFAPVILLSWLILGWNVDLI